MKKLTKKDIEMTKAAWNTMPGVAYIQKVQNVMIARLAGKEFPTPLDEFSFEDKDIEISIVLSNAHYDDDKSAVLGHIDGMFIDDNDSHFSGYAVWDPHKWVYPWVFLGNPEQPEEGIVLYGLNGEQNNNNYIKSDLMHFLSVGFASQPFKGKTDSYKDRLTKGLFQRCKNRINLNYAEVEEVREQLIHILTDKKKKLAQQDEEKKEETSFAAEVAVGAAKLAFKGAAFGAKLAFKGLAFGAKKAYEHYRK